MPISENSTENENTFWIYFLIVVIIIIILYIFFQSRESFTTNISSFFSPKSLSKLSKAIENNLPEDKAMKIIQKINKTALAMENQQNSNSNSNSNSNQKMYNNLKPNLNQNINYSQSPSNPISQYAMNLSNDVQTGQSQDQMYPNLGSAKPYSPSDQVIQNISKMPISQDTPDERSVKLMNQAGFIDGEKVACNLLGVNSADMDSYKQKFYSMYAHQIECPAKCALQANGMSKGCGMGSKCGLAPNCSNVNTDTSIPDTFALNYLALNNANKKPCVTCNYKPTNNPLNRQWMEKAYPSYDGLPENVVMADEARLKKMNLIDANVSNYVNFNNNVYQDSIGESAPDKLNELRTCQDAYGTCGLQDYGTSIANAYDKLTANPAYTARNNCNPYQLTGILDDAASSDMYASV
jgi:hypothetical protein